MFVCSSYLCDVTLKSEDGKEFPCHKSVLCARQGELLWPIYKVKYINKYISVNMPEKCLLHLFHVIKEILIYWISLSFPEYFHSMLGNPWIEVGWILFIYFFLEWGLLMTVPVSPWLHDVHQLHNVCLVLPPQATSCTALEMPTSSEILQVILEYIYTDESPTIKGKVFFSMSWKSTEQKKKKKTWFSAFMFPQSLWMSSSSAMCW